MDRTSAKAHPRLDVLHPQCFGKWVIPFCFEAQSVIGNSQVNKVACISKTE